MSRQCWNVTTFTNFVLKIFVNIFTKYHLRQKNSKTRNTLTFPKIHWFPAAKTEQSTGVGTANKQTDKPLEWIKIKSFKLDWNIFNFTECQTIVNWGDWLGSLANIKVTNKRCQDLCWKVHDPAQSFVFPSHTMCFVQGQGYKTAQ